MREEEEKRDVIHLQENNLFFSFIKFSCQIFFSLNDIYEITNFYFWIQSLLA